MRDLFKRLERHYKPKLPKSASEADQKRAKEITFYHLYRQIMDGPVGIPAVRFAKELRDRKRLNLIVR